MTEPDSFGESFLRDGFSVARGVFTGELLAAMLTDFDRIVEQLVASGEEINARWQGA